MTTPSAHSLVAADESAEREQRGSVALDQWRGLALVMVLISHGLFFTNRVNGIGRVGVNLFFFISGILVFRSLSRSRAGSGFNLARSFWWRRLRRLYPAVLAYAVVMLPAVWLLQNRPHLPPASDVSSYLKALPPALGYCINYVEDHPLSLGHLWSLACEMQFYILAPLMFLAGGVQPARRWILWGGMLLVLMGLGFSHPLYFVPHVFHSEYGKYHFEFAVWPMMAGFVGEWRRDWFRQLPDKWVTFLLWSSALVCTAILCITPFFAESKSIVVATGAFLLLPCMVAYVAGRPVPPEAGGGLLRFLGERTYSIYLWQQPLTLCNYLPEVWHPLGSILAIGLGSIWFQFFERPFLSSNRHK